MSKRKRIKKLVKGYLNRIDADGNIADAVDTLVKRKAVLKTMDAETNTVLLNRLGFTDAGKPGLEAFDIDGDTTKFKNDFAPFDATEQVDTDKDGIGDNRDILRTKVLLDAIFQDLQTKAVTKLARATGTLQRLMDEAEAVQLLIKTQFETLDANHDGTLNGDAAAITAAQEAIAALVAVDTTDKTISGAFDVVDIAGALFTSAGLDKLVADIDIQVAQVASLKAEIAAKTAKAGVVVKNPTVTGYTAAGDSVLAQTTAASTATGAVADTTAIADLAAAAKLRITKIVTNADDSSGAKAMLTYIATITA
jgi:hypothetical protein